MVGLMVPMILTHLYDYSEYVYIFYTFMRGNQEKEIYIRESIEHVRVSRKEREKKSTCKAIVKERKQEHKKEQ